ncbi:hypothetical protein ACJMK2_003257 [Sinanodonta woodiana]|uniref:EGF-like domain-containing protein n=1 Tax=Sinanodonta woodiana TaxID=1069815 RepID=A0ABD3XXU1_SINWO
MFAQRISITGTPDHDNIFKCKKDLGMIMTLKNKTFTKDLFVLPLNSKTDPISGSIRSYRCPENALFTSLSGEYTLQHLYVYDYYSHTIYRDDKFSIGQPVNDVMMIFHRGISSDYVNIAVDWISRNIYWTDPSYKWIMVKSLTSNDLLTNELFRVLIDDDLNGPRALTLDPMEGLLFWSDIGASTKIEVSTLSGVNRKTLISTKLIYPYSLAADYAARRLFLYDSGRKSLESFTYEGKDRKTVLEDEQADIFGIAVYQNSLYVTDRAKSKYLIVDKTSGELLYESPTTGALGVSLFHPDDTFKSSKAPCINHGCRHLCVAEKGVASCFCKDGYYLDRDGRKCSLRTEYFHRGLVFTNASRICVVDIRVVADFAFDPKCFMYTETATHMVMDTDRRRMILVNRKTIYWVSFADLPYYVFVARPKGIISGLAWDGYKRHVYYTEQDSGIIWKQTQDPDKPQVFYKDLARPRDIIVLSHERLMYWITDREGPTIESINIDGSNHRIVLDSKALVDPKSLCYDQYNKRIYFLDSLGEDRTNIKSFDLDGSSIRLFRLSNRKLDLLEIYKGHLLVTSNDATSTLIQSYSISTGEETTSGVFPGTGHISTLRIFDENIRQNKYGPCFHSNGECEDFCIPQGNRRVCGCRFGFQLSRNGRNCTSDPDLLEFLLVVDSTDNTVYQINFDPLMLSGIDIKSSESLSGITYSPFDEVFIFGATSKLYIAHLNGTIKSVFPVPPSEDVVFTPNRFAVDHSTGNIYYTVANNQRLNKRYESYIAVISRGGKQRTLIKGLIDPSGLVVYPSKGLLFYSEGDMMPCLGKARMDGSRWTVILTLPGENPKDLTIDYKSDNLYYIDSVAHSVKYCKLDGTGHKTLIGGLGDISVLAATVYNNHLFFSTARNSMIMKVDFSNPSARETFVDYGELGRISFISMFSNRNRNTNSVCSYKNGGCSTFCFPIPDSGVCGCEDGLELTVEGGQVCSNTKDHVFLMTLSNLKCKQSIFIQRIDFAGIPVDRYVRPYSCTGETLFTAIAGDHVLQHTYMYDYYSHTIYRDSSFSVESSGDNAMTMFHKGLSRDYINLAVDWISHNIYWTDISFKWIMVKSLTSNDMSMYRVLIHENLDEPRALALDPMEGLLFWSDTGNRPKIEVSSLSGRNRKTLLSSKLKTPLSLAADYAARHLYLYDSGRQTMETFTYEGKDRKTLFKHENTILFNIVVYKDHLYMTDRSGKRFRIMDKTDGYIVHTENTNLPFLGLTMFHPDVTSSSSSACISLGCEHICVAEKDVATCLCKDGYTLNEDAKTCSLRTQHFHRGLVFSNDSSICIADIRVVTDVSFDATCFMNVQGTTHMVLDTDQRRVILVIGTSIFWASVDTPKLNLLTDTRKQISGIAWDGYDRSVYWTEVEKGSIWKHTTRTARLLKNLKKPRDIIVLSQRRLLFWISERDGVTIEASNSDGSNHRIVLGSGKMADPRSLSYDQYKNKIYFLDTFDNDKTKIVSCELDGSSLRSFRHSNAILAMLEIYKGHLLVTANDAKGTLFTSYSITTGKETTSGLIPDTGKMTAIKIFDENIRQSERGKYTKCSVRIT